MGIGGAIKQNLDKAKEKTDDIEIIDSEGNFSLKIKENNIIDNSIELLNKLEDTPNQLDALLIYDYYKSQNFLLFSPIFKSSPNSEIMIRRIDLFKMKEILNNIGGKNRITLDIIKDAIVDKRITKEAARNTVTNNKSVLKNLNIDISKEDYNSFKKTNYVVSATVNDVTTNYFYDEFKTKYLDTGILDKYWIYSNKFHKSTQKTLKFPMGAGRDLDYKMRSTYYLINSVGGFDTIDTLPNTDINKNDNGIKGIYKDESADDFIKQFSLDFKFNIEDLYKKTCGVFTTPTNGNMNLFLFEWIQEIGATVSVEGIIKAIKMIMGMAKPRYYITFNELFTEYLGKERNYLKEKIFEDVDKIKDRVEIFESCSQLFSQTEAMRKAAEKLEKSKFLSEQESEVVEMAKAIAEIISIGVKLTQDEREKVIYYYKRQAVINFVNVFLKKFETTTSGQFGLSKNKISRFLKVFYENSQNMDPASKAVLSFEEFQILNTYAHVYANDLLVKSNYDKAGFVTDIFYEISEAGKEKIGMFIDDKIERNRVYLYQITQASTEEAEGSIS